MRMSETRMACMPSWLARQSRITRNMPKRRLFTFEPFPFCEWLNGRRGQKLFRLPTVDNPLLGGVVMQSQLPAPHHKRLSFATKANEPVNAGVGVLFTTRSPSAVARLVISIVVDAVNALFAGPLAHVFKKVFKLQPAVADFDSSRAVSMIVDAVDIIAPLDHGTPDVVNTAPGSAMSASRLPHSRAFLAPAAARLRAPDLGKLVSNNLPNGATKTAADVNRGVATLSTCVMKNSPAIESLPSQIICHTSTLTVDKGSMQEVYYG